MLPYYASLLHMKRALLSEKIKRLFTMGCAWEVEESLTTLGTIVALKFLN
jgi:hypothetical protein